MKSLLQVQQDYLTSAYQFLLPEMALIGMACVLFLLAVIAPSRSRALIFGLIGIISAAVLTLFVSVPVFQDILGWQEVSTFWKIVEGTPFYPRAISPFDPTGPATFVRWLSLAAATLFLFLSWSEVRDDNASEYAACVLIMTAGLSLVGRANDFITLFLALEMISIPTYVLLYLPSQSKAGLEATVKYFLLSLISSAILLFGFSYIYGLTGTTNIGASVDVLNDAHKISVSPMALIGIVMIIAGLGFRITAVPFHFYAPDVYEGGPTGVIAQLAYVPKVAGFLALARILGMLYPPINQLPFDANSTLIPLTLWVLAVVTMSFGNLLALLQDNLKRMLAYSGVAHGGYMLMGVIVASSLADVNANTQPNQVGLDSVLFYLSAYGLMTIGAFAILLHLSGTTKAAESVDDLAGLGQTHPVSAAMLALFLCSMIGLPLTAGFVGKFLLFVGAIDAPTTASMKQMYRILVLIAALNAAIGAVYYLRVLGVMYLRSPLKPVESSRSYPALLVALVCAIGTIAFGVYPKPLADAAKAAIPIQDDQPRASGPAPAVRP